MEELDAKRSMLQDLQGIVLELQGTVAKFANQHDQLAEEHAAVTTERDTMAAERAAFEEASAAEYDGTALMLEGALSRLVSAEEVQAALVNELEAALATQCALHKEQTFELEQELAEQEDETAQVELRLEELHAVSAAREEASSIAEEELKRHHAVELCGKIREMKEVARQLEQKDLTLRQTQVDFEQVTSPPLFPAPFLDRRNTHTHAAADPAPSHDAHRRSASPVTTPSTTPKRPSSSRSKPKSAVRVRLVTPWLF